MQHLVKKARSLGAFCWDQLALRQLTHFTAERIAQFAFSPDSSQIAFERGHTESDAVLLRDVSR